MFPVVDFVKMRKQAILYYLETSETDYVETKDEGQSARSNQLSISCQRIGSFFTPRAELEVLLR